MKWFICSKDSQQKEEEGKGQDQASQSPGSQWQRCYRRGKVDDGHRRRRSSLDQLLPINEVLVWMVSSLNLVAVVVSQLSLVSLVTRFEAVALPDLGWLSIRCSLFHRPLSSPFSPSITDRLPRYQFLLTPRQNHSNTT